MKCVWLASLISILNGSEITPWIDRLDNFSRNVGEMKLSEAAEVLWYETDKGQSTCENLAADCLSP